MQRDDYAGAGGTHIGTTGPPTQDRRPVMVTTVHWGVFVGLLAEDRG